MTKLQTGDRVRDLVTGVDGMVLWVHGWAVNVKLDDQELPITVESRDLRKLK